MYYNIANTGFASPTCTNRGVMRNGPFFVGGIGNFQKDHNNLCTRKIVKIVLALAEPREKKIEQVFSISRYFLSMPKEVLAQAIAVK